MVVRFRALSSFDIDLEGDSSGKRCLNLFADLLKDSREEKGSHDEADGTEGRLHVIPVGQVS